ncbi:murein DD-endopeptidase MepM/ murein hydrolase activator NlpD [Agromyces hippuratus]|uniref:Murein DD-endopeptidase MepM/ murein hydrolase activator NlpD n=1 Tax=Agromyces hippuratus TaxID=286438 RepID=A0A852WPF5_9MICO|nr:M23 family metallopeptidase [Agromyces hippuratus]NYG20052.1 murein DD-endopeptidase MepM/ murein hydrolase activator NlpD [Agromyces hippuratus]
MTVALAFILAVSSGTGAASAASDYPSWADVQKARASEAAKQAQIAELEAFIVTLTAEAQAAEELATRRGTEYEQAQASFDEATYRATQLETQAQDATARADESSRQAGQLAAMLARTGSTDLSMTMLLDSANAAGLLSRLGTMSKLTERTTQIYQQATTDRNTAAAVAEQAKLAGSLLGDLAKTAEIALTAAIDTRASAHAKLAAQQQIEATMRAQLAVLAENREATEADFESGEAARRAVEAAAAATEAAAGSGDGGLDSGQLSNQGWALPVAGRNTDRFGPRPNRPVAGVGAFHYGTDIAAACGRSVYAATSGTVVYADELGSYGLWVLIDHGNGVQTGYAHNSDLYVRVGQYVGAGANIASVGTTGASTGCHLHYEVRVDGARIDPEPFMSARGVTLD